MTVTVTTRFTHRHRFEPATAPGVTPLLLLHGTGGSEDDLIELGRAVAPGAALVAPRGNVLENGAPRFFRRFAEGVFDHDDVRARADDLARFVAEVRDAHGVSTPVVLGFSNGANAAAALTMRHPEAVAGAVLIRAMVPLPDRPTALDGKPVLLLSGDRDPIVPPENSDRLAALLHAAGAEVTHRRLLAAHGLTRADVETTAAWLAARAAQA